MDWNLAIERNREALKRILAGLVAMAGLGAFTSPLAGEDGSPRRGEAETLGGPGERYVRPTLPRYRYLSVLRLLRPAESAARRLIVVAARELVVPPPRPRKPASRKPGTASAFLRRPGGTGILLPRGAHPGRGPAQAAPVSMRLSLPLTDPLRRPLSLSNGRPRRPTTTGVPRISVPGASTPAPLPRSPSPFEPVDSTRLAMRLAALGRALDDLPREARRFARWRAGQSQVADTPPASLHEPPSASRRGRAPGSPPSSPSTEGAGFSRGGDRARRRISPLRLGRPPGQRSRNSRQPAHDVHEVLADLHWFATQALHPDTS